MNINTNKQPLNTASRVFKNNNLMQHIYTFDNTYHLIYHDILDECYSAYKNFWNKKLNKIVLDYKNYNQYNEILYVFWNNYRISSKYAV
jgi:hypothetical protein